MIILGIETSCDETSAALLEINRGKFKLLSHVLSSSLDKQKPYGGIVPEVAARKQIEYIIPVLQEALGNSKLQVPNNKQITNSKFKIQNKSAIDAIAVTQGGPGLVTSMQVGVDTAKTLAYIWQKPLIPVIHMEGHVYSALLKPHKTKLEKPQFPAVVLTVSGGHTELLLVKDYLKYKLLGRTRDDAAGEAFDKVARLLGLAYPGGPVISRLAKQGDPTSFNFPRPMIDSGNYDLSFSGLKTAVLYKLKELNLSLAKKENKKGSTNKLTSYKLKADLCASFQQAVIDVLVTKTVRAAKEYKVKTILLGGGVAANDLLRKTLIGAVTQMNKKIKVLIPDLSLTTDNAAMIALAGYFRYKAGDYLKPNPQLKAWQKIKAEPNLRLT